MAICEGIALYLKNDDESEKILLTKLIFLAILGIGILAWNVIYQVNSRHFGSVSVLAKAYNSAGSDVISASWICSGD